MHILYADDLQIYVQVPKDSIDVGIQTLQQAARAVAGWDVGASLKLNKLKTKAIVFGGNRFINDFYSSAASRTIDLGMVPAYHSLTPSQLLALCLIRSFHGKRILTMLPRNSIV